MATEPDREPIRQLLVHPAVWPHLIAWLASRRIVVAELRLVAVPDGTPGQTALPLVPYQPTLGSL